MPRVHPSPLKKHKHTVQIIFEERPDIQTCVAPSTLEACFAEACALYQLELLSSADAWLEHQGPDGAWQKLNKASYSLLKDNIPLLKLQRKPRVLAAARLDEKVSLVLSLPNGQRTSVKLRYGTTFDTLVPILSACLQHSQMTDAPAPLSSVLSLTHNSRPLHLGDTPGQLQLKEGDVIECTFAAAAT